MTNGLTFMVGPKKKKTRNHNLKLKRSAVFEKQNTFFFVLVRCKMVPGFQVLLVD